MKSIGKAEMPIIDKGSKFNTVITAVGTGDTDCYVVPANHTTIVKNLMLTNENASARTFTIKIFQKSPTPATTPIIVSHSLATITSTNIFTTTVPLFLAAEDKIIISASHASSITSTISVEEFYDPSR